VPDIRALLAAGAGRAPRDQLDLSATMAAVRRLRRRRRGVAAGTGALVLGGIVAVGAATLPPEPREFVLAPGGAETSTAAKTPLPAASPVPSPSIASEAPDPAAATVAMLASADGCEGTGEELATWFQPLVEPGTSRASSPLTFRRIAVAEALGSVAVPAGPAGQAACAIALRNGEAVAMELRGPDGATLVRSGSVPRLAEGPPQASGPTLGSGQPIDARLDGDLLSGLVRLEDHPAGTAVDRFVWVKASVPGDPDLLAVTAQLHLATTAQAAQAGYLVPDVLPPGFAPCDWYAPTGGEVAAACDAQARLLVVRRKRGDAGPLDGRPVPVAGRVGAVVEADGLRTVSVLVNGDRYSAEAPLDVPETAVVAALASVLEDPVVAATPPRPTGLPDASVLLNVLQRVADARGVGLRSVTITDPDPSAPPGTDVQWTAELVGSGEATDIAGLQITPLARVDVSEVPAGDVSPAFVCAGHRFTVKGAVEATGAFDVLEQLVRELGC